MKHQRYINAGTIDLSTIRIGQEVGGGEAAVVVTKPTAKISANTSTRTIEVNDSLSVVFSITPTKGTYDLDKAELLVDNVVKDTLTNVASATTTAFKAVSLTKNSTGNVSVTVKVYDKKGNTAVSSALTFTVGYKCYYLFSDADLFDGKRTGDWVKANSTSYISVNRTKAQATYTSTSPKIFYFLIPHSYACSDTNIQDNSTGSWMAGAFEKAANTISISTTKNANVVYDIFGTGFITDITAKII